MSKASWRGFPKMSRRTVIRWCKVHERPQEIVGHCEWKFVKGYMSIHRTEPCEIVTMYGDDGPQMYEQSNPEAESIPPLLEGLLSYVDDCYVEKWGYREDVDTVRRVEVPEDGR